RDRNVTGVQTCALPILDSRLQQAAWDLLGDRRGAVAVMEPDTGKILAMVSKPDYDPNTIGEDWDRLTADEGGEARLLNRATQGQIGRASCRAGGESTVG